MFQRLLSIIVQETKIKRTKMINQDKKAGGFRSVARGISSATLLVFLLVFVLLLFPVLTFCFLILLASLFVLGGDFWDKLRSLFIHDATVSFTEA